jgi:ADP-ribosyl-[dinitrogen reductase] hydrolase
MAELRWDLDDVRDRARAAFLGAALGDALGATVEFMTPAEIQAAHRVHREITGGGWLHLRPGAVTDDTEMSLWAARALAANGGFQARAVADAFVAWLRARPTDVGNAVRRGLRRYIHDGTLEGPRAEGDGGNGAAMRMVPFALVTLADGPLLKKVAIAQARITHHHPLSDAAAVHLGELVHAACLGLSRAHLARASASLVERFPAFRFAPYRGLAGGYVVETIQTVLHFFHATRSFEECLVAVVNQGGDADTTGAIAGALAGACYGPAELPARWLRRLEPALREEISGLADRLVDLSPLARGEPPSLGEV